jgi:hypothetical protein
MTNQPITAENDAIYGVGITLGSDGEGFEELSAFLSLSRSGSALVSNEIKYEDGERSMLVHVRKVDGNLADAGVLMSEGITRRAVLKSMRDAGVKVKTYTGVSAGGQFAIH